MPKKSNPTPLRLPPVRLSPTTLANWYKSGCPAAWAFSRAFTQIEPNIHLQLGLAVHDLMQGLALPKDFPDGLGKTAVTICAKLNDLKTTLGLTAVLDGQGKAIVERKYEWEVRPGVQYVCKIDLLAETPEGESVIVDWKSTLGNGWKSLIADETHSFVPQALTFQSISYLLPPDAAAQAACGLPLERSWPKKLLYLVGPARGPCQLFEYRPHEEDYANFQIALELAAVAIRAGAFPKVHGRHCFECEWRDPCYQVEGWEQRFRPYTPAAVDPPEPG